MHFYSLDGITYELWTEQANGGLVGHWRCPKCDLEVSTRDAYPTAAEAAARSERTVFIDHHVPVHRSDW
jgi:hypothetical protein